MYMKVLSKISKCNTIYELTWIRGYIKGLYDADIIIQSDYNVLCHHIRARQDAIQYPISF